MTRPAGAGMGPRLTETVHCPACGQGSDGVFHTDADTVEDIVDQPVGEHRCPTCGHRFITGLRHWPRPVEDR